MKSLNSILRHPLIERVCDWMEKQKVVSMAEVPVAVQALIVAALQKRAALQERERIVVVAPSISKQEELSEALGGWGVDALLFPESLTESGEEISDPQTRVEQLAVLRAFRAAVSKPLLTTAAGAKQPLPLPEQLNEGIVSVDVGQKFKLDTFLQKLTEAGYEEEYFVAARGQFAHRGGIVDFWSLHGELPVRMEWMGDEIESIREFDPTEQSSLRSLNQAEWQSARFEDAQKTATLNDYLPHNGLRLFLAAEESAEQLPAEWMDARAHDLFHHVRQDPVLAENRRGLIRNLLEDWARQKFQIGFVCHNEGEMLRLREWMHDELKLGEEWMMQNESLLFFAESSLHRGFVWPAARLALLTDAEIFNRYQSIHLSSANRSERRQRMDRAPALRARAALDLNELALGDYVVHADHGIALYHGMETIDSNGENGARRQALALGFRNGAKLYVPIDQAHLISKYVGAGKKHPPLDELGSSRWKRARSQAQKAALDYAAQLLHLQAQREVLEGHAFGEDPTWQTEFERAFLYQPTEDQQKAIAATKEDMQRRRPMDRLICGDVGFGKTEVAIRAAFKAVMGGKQAAFLAPTTILAHQHYQTLCERMADYPITIDLLSRFRSRSEQDATLKKVAAGSVDIVVGTHRLLSDDVRFSDLGLVVVDEEQRFGVKQKEKLKFRFPLVDVLTLSATPIPRTLYLSLVGARDMSTIDTPPPGRLPVETSVHPYDERLIRSAISRELARGGQVYFLHNRIESIDRMAEKLNLLLPEARIQVAHGQMDADQLEEAMRRFVEREADILLCTTIIESGLDIPNANTIIIDRADRFGLADLYQLRGRVGRSGVRAYALLFLPREFFTTADARRRVQAMSDYAQLGAGYKIAMRDLELRGAGHFLGTAQSGHIGAVGFELYCRLLKESVRRLKGESNDSVASPMRDTYLRFDFLSLSEGDDSASTSYAYIPSSYIADLSTRVAAYRRLWEASSRRELDTLEAQWRDAFGRYPMSVELLLAAYRVKFSAAAAGIESVEVKEYKLKLKKQGAYLMQGHQFPRLTPQGPLSMLAEIEQWITVLEPV